MEIISKAKLDSKDNSEVIELSVLGTGGGYGESIVIGLKNRTWIIIDSCIDPINKEVLPITYLREKGVNLALDVKLIICTHWHCDHIRGLSKLLDLCSSSEFVIPFISDIQKFLLFIEFDSNINSDTNNESTKEFSKCLEVINSRNGSINRAISDLLIFRDTSIVKNFEIFSLSPSQKVVREFDLEISTMIEIVSKFSRTIPLRKPNEKCIVLYIKINEYRILLGADMEISSDERRGWKDIINNSKIFDNTPLLIFKIPHHGSKNGYSKELCNMILTKDSKLKVTPYNKGKKKLPDSAVINTYKIHSPDIYITSTESGKNPKEREKSITKAIKELKPSLTEVKFYSGIVTTQFFDKGNLNLITQIKGTARKL